MTKKIINKISDKLSRVNDSFTVNMYDNGYLFEISGKCEDDEWRGAKILVPTLDKLLELVKEATEIPRDGDCE